MIALNIPKLLGRSEEEKVAADCIFSHPDDHIHNLITLSRVCNVRVTFKTPFKKVKKGRWYSEPSRVHVFGGFFEQGGSFYYKAKSNGRRGYYMPEVSDIESYEPVIASLSVDEFKSLEDFAARFDKRFITQAYIEDLWAKPSGQTGERYNKRDFHRIGRQGLWVLERFMRRFVDVNTETPGHTKRGDYSVLEEWYKTLHHLGRDITISHTVGSERVRYSSEFQGCGNGRYGLVANMKEFLHLEDD